MDRTLAATRASIVRRCLSEGKKSRSALLHLRLGFPTLPWWGAPALKLDRSLVMADASSEEAVQQYSSLLEQISSSPYQRDLHLERVRLAKQLGLSDEVEQGRQAYAQFLALSEGAYASTALSQGPELTRSAVLQRNGSSGSRIARRVCRNCLPTTSRRTST